MNGTGVPEWFARAVAQLPEHRGVRVDGVDVRYRTWGEPSSDGVVLVHGHAAHAGWWDHIAPLLHRRVVALDLSGHGDSGRRQEYALDPWADEVLAVADDAGLRAPVVVGHSLGGWVCLALAARRGEALRAVVAVDSPLNDADWDPELLAQRRRPHRVYPDEGTALARFRTAPPQDVVLPYVQDRIGRQSLRRVEGGWTWAFDPRSFDERRKVRDLLPRVSCPAALVRCALGRVDAGTAQEMVDLTAGNLRVVPLEQAGHHPMLDRPLALVEVLDALLAGWPSGS